MAFGIVENRQWHAPCALAGDAPIRPGLHGATNAVAAPVREPCGGIDFFEGLGADVFDADEELLDGAEDDRRLGAPAVWVGVFMGSLSGKGSFLLQKFDDAGIRLKDIFADELGQAALLGVASVVIDGGKQREPTLHAEMVVVLAMAWRDMNAACAGIQRHKGCGMNRGIARQEGMTGLKALQFRAGDCFFDGKFFSSDGCAERVQKGFGENDGFFNALETHADHGVLVAGVDGDGEVRWKCPRGGRPDHNGSLACKFSAHEREENIDRRGGFILVFDFGFGERRLSAGAPENGFLLAIDEAFFHEAGERADHAGLIGGIKCEVGVFPVTEDAETAELAALNIDEFAGVFLRAATHLGGGETCGGFDHPKFDREAVAIPTRNERSTEACHRFGFNHEVLENLVERRPHVDIAIREGRSIVEKIERSIFATLLDFFVKPLLFPLGQRFRFTLGQAGLHGKIGFRKIDRVFVSAHEKRKRLSVGDRWVNATK